MKEEEERIKGIRSFSTHEKSPFHKGSEVIIEGKKGVTSVWSNAKGRADIRRATPLSEDDLRRHYFESAKDFFSFSSNARQVLIYLDSVANFKELTAEVDFEKAKQQTGYRSEQSIFSGIAELLEMGFIARASDKNIYYLNPMIFSQDKQILNTNHFFKK